MKTLYHMATRHGLYSIALQESADGSFQIREYKRGLEQGYANLGLISYDAALNEYHKRIQEYAAYDQIYYVKAVR